MGKRKERKKRYRGSIQEVYHPTNNSRKAIGAKKGQK
jgi:hypothetical protein